MLARVCSVVETSSVYWLHWVLGWALNANTLFIPHFPLRKIPWKLILRCCSYLSIDVGRVKKILSIALDKLPVSLIAVCNSSYLSSIWAISCSISKQTCLYFYSCELNVLEVHLFLTTCTHLLSILLPPQHSFFFFSPRDRMILRINMKE